MIPSIALDEYYSREIERRQSGSLYAMRLSKFASVVQRARDLETYDKWAEAAVVWGEAGREAMSEAHRLFALVRASHARLLAMGQAGPPRQEAQKTNPEKAR